ncbi:MAG: hypothetical protein R3185_01895 [Candidatus Thermoplasmatota archaeon]|nr:hypothetical protein [Candidatus Thermoplasmatota archaeon]
MTKDERTVDAKEQHPADLEVDLSTHSQAVAQAMTGRLGLWATREDALLFLASLALSQGEDPVAGDDVAETVTLELDQQARSQLTLMGLVLDEQASPLEVIGENLTGLVEAGARVLGPRLAGKGPAEATGEITELLETLA